MPIASGNSSSARFRDRSCPYISDLILGAVAKLSLYLLFLSL